MTVRQEGTGSSLSLTLQFHFSFVGEFEPLKNFRIFPTNRFNFPINAYVHFKFLSTGLIRECIISPKLPEGLDYDYDGFYGKISDINKPDFIGKEYSIECRNEYSIANKLYFYAGIIDGVNNNAIKASFWVPILSSELDCREKYDPFFDSNLKISTQKYVDNIQKPFSESVKWEGLGPKFTEYWGVVYEGYITIPANGKYKFYVKSQHGVWIEINGEETVSAPGCRLYNDEQYDTTEIELDNDVYPIRILYFHNGGGSGLEIFYSYNNQANQTLNIGNLGYGKYLK